MRALNAAALALVVSSSACFEPPAEGSDAGSVEIAEVVEGCAIAGATDRVGFRGLAPRAGLCAGFVLVETFGDNDLELDVQGWKTQGRTVHAAPCSRWGTTQETRKMRGRVIFDAQTTEFPLPAAVDVYIETGREDPAEIRLVGNVVDFGASCL